MLLKKRFLLSIFGIFLSLISSIISAEHNRRHEKYTTFENYLDSFSEGKINHEQPKILIIGGGLAYDDMVQGSETRFFAKLHVDWEKKRPHYYPTNAYLVDLDGKFYYLDKVTDYSSISDLHANISTKAGFSDEFNGKFDIIILEYLSYEALNSNTFKNCWSFLKPGGIIITNNHISREPYVKINCIEQDLSLKPGIEIFNVSDTHNNQITVFYPLAGIVSTKLNVFYLYSPHQLTSNQTVIDFVSTNMQNTNSNEYLIDINNKITAHARSAHFLQSIKGFLNQKFPDFSFTSIEFTHNPEKWYAPPDSSGYLVWKK